MKYNEKSDDRLSNHYYKLVIYLIVMVIIAVFLLVSCSVMDKTLDSAEQQIASVEESRLSLISEETGIAEKHIIESKSFFNDYYEYTTSEGNYQVIFDGDFEEIKSIVKVQ